jgi:hypothetical protein
MRENLTSLFFRLGVIFQGALANTLRYEQILWITIMHLSSIINCNL